MSNLTKFTAQEAGNMGLGQRGSILINQSTTDADANTGRFYKIPGPVEKSFELTPDNYVVRLLENSIDTIEDCIFCDQSFRNRIFADYVTVFAVKDKYPVTEGHTLIIPYRHCSDYFEMTITEKQHVDELISQINLLILCF